MNLITCVVENGKPTARKVNWYNYYSPIRAKFGAQYLVACSDNDQIPDDYTIPIQRHDAYFMRPELTENALNVITFKEELPPRVDGATYPRHWRSLLACFELGQDLGADHLLTLESDSWVLTPRLAERLITLPAGIGCPWCPLHDMAELMLASYHRDVFPMMIAFIKSKSWEEWAKPQPHNLERTLSRVFNLTIWREMIGDRYVEYLPPANVPPADADFIIQGEATPPVWKG
jgi:hypothetical protein